MKRVFVIILLLITCSVLLYGCGSPEPTASEKQQIETALDHVRDRQKIYDDAMGIASVQPNLGITQQLKFAETIIKADQKARSSDPIWMDKDKEETLMLKYKDYTEKRIDSRPDKNMYQYAIKKDK